MEDQQDKGSVETDAKPSRRGFAAMDRARVRELARLGGKSAHQRGKAHEFTSEEARIAGRKGGLASHHHQIPNPEVTERVSVNP
jgi:general stress protein YciG